MVPELFWIFGNYFLAKSQKIKNKHCLKIRRVCLSNTPLTKNRGFKICLKAMFDKHTLRTKYDVFSFENFKPTKYCFIINGLNRATWLGFLAQRFKSTNMTQNQKTKE
jgi:hypothetical protein